MSKMVNEKEYLVWNEIGGSLTDISSAWWDQPEDVRTG